MTIATSVQRYLADRGVDYDIMTHQPTHCSAETVAASRVTPDSLAKAIVLKTEDGYMLAVLSASRHVDLGQLRRYFERPIGLASEQEVASLFADCRVGAVPAIGAAYGLEVVVDDELAAQPDVFFEGGDHTSLVHVSQADFAALMRGARHARFGRPH